MGARPDAGTTCADNGQTILSCGGAYAIHCGTAVYASGSQCIEGTGGNFGCGTPDAGCPTETACINGSVLDYCTMPGNVPQRFNCAYDGYNCGIASNTDGGFFTCNAGEQYLTCTSPGATDCVGAVLQVCDGFELSEFDCAALGGTCTSSGGSALCTQSTDTCTPFDSDENVCAGTSISICIGGQKQMFDCASVGFNCIGPQSAHCG